MWTTYSILAKTYQVKDVKEFSQQILSADILIIQVFLLSLLFKVEGKIASQFSTINNSLKKIKEYIKFLLCINLFN